MSKTAEEILNSHLVEVDKALFKRCVEPAMREFAAQEVEAYKKRVLANMEKLRSESEPTLWERGWNMARLASVAVINQAPLIDTVK